MTIANFLKVKGKPVESRGRKATDLQRNAMMAGLSDGMMKTLFCFA